MTAQTNHIIGWNCRSKMLSQCARDRREREKKRNSPMKTKDLSRVEKIALSFPSLKVLTIREFNWKWNFKKKHQHLRNILNKNSWYNGNEIQEMMQDEPRRRISTKQKNKMKTVWSHLSSDHHKYDTFVQELKKKVCRDYSIHLASK